MKCYENNWSPIHNTSFSSLFTNGLNKLECLFRLVQPLLKYQQSTEIKISKIRIALKYSLLIIFILMFLSTANSQRPSNHLSCCSSCSSWIFHYFTPQFLNLSLISLNGVRQCQITVNGWRYCFNFDIAIQLLLSATATSLH